MNRPYEFWYYISAWEGLNFVISHRRLPSVTSIKSSLHATYSIHPSYLPPITKICKNIIVCCRMYTLKVSWQMHKAGCKFIGKLLHSEHKQDRVLQILNVRGSEIKRHQHARNSKHIEYTEHIFYMMHVLGKMYMKQLGRLNLYWVINGSSYP